MSGIPRTPAKVITYVMRAVLEGFSILSLLDHQKTHVTHFQTNSRIVPRQLVGTGCKRNTYACKTRHTLPNHRPDLPKYCPRWCRKGIHPATNERVREDECMSEWVVAVVPAMAIGWQIDYLDQTPAPRQEQCLHARFQSREEFRASVLRQSSYPKRVGDRGDNLKRMEATRRQIWSAIHKTPNIARDSHSIW